MTPNKIFKISATYIRKTISIVVLFAFILTLLKSEVYSQNIQDSMPRLPVPGVMVHLSPEFSPALLKGIVIHPEDAFKFDFIINKGDQKLSDQEKRNEYTKLIKYFLTSLSLPEDDLWVNLSPYEKNRIIKDDFGKTEMGRNLLAEDYMLKQITASLIYPQEKLGQEFWDKVYAKTYKQFGTTNIPINTFNKVWIVPDKAQVMEQGNMAFVQENHLKVMLEEDYLSLTKHNGIQLNRINDQNKTHLIGSEIVREIILPALEQEVNLGKNFASLRQIFSGAILAAWYKNEFKETVLAQIYINKSRLKGVDQNPQNNQLIYQQYLRAFKKGVFNYIKEDLDKYTQETIPRKYFSGGTKVEYKNLSIIQGSQAQVAAAVENFDKAEIVSVINRKIIPVVKNQNNAMSSKFIKRVVLPLIVTGAIGLSFIAPKAVNYLQVNSRTQAIEQIFKRYDADLEQGKVHGTIEEQSKFYLSDLMTQFNYQGTTESFINYLQDWYAKRGKFFTIGTRSIFLKNEGEAKEILTPTFADIVELPAFTHPNMPDVGKINFIGIGNAKYFLPKNRKIPEKEAFVNQGRLSEIVIDNDYVIKYTQSLIELSNTYSRLTDDQLRVDISNENDDGESINKLTALYLRRIYGNNPINNNAEILKKLITDRISVLATHEAGHIMSALKNIIPLNLPPYIQRVLHEERAGETGFFYGHHFLGLIDVISWKLTEDEHLDAANGLIYHITEAAKKYIKQPNFKIKGSSQFERYVLAEMSRLNERDIVDIMLTAVESLEHADKMKIDHFQSDQAMRSSLKKWLGLGIGVGIFALTGLSVWHYYSSKSHLESKQTGTTVQNLNQSIRISVRDDSLMSRAYDTFESIVDAIEFGINPPPGSKPVTKLEKISEELLSLNPSIKINQQQENNYLMIISDSLTNGKFNERISAIGLLWNSHLRNTSQKNNLLFIALKDTNPLIRERAVMNFNISKENFQFIPLFREKLDNENNPNVRTQLNLLIHNLEILRDKDQIIQRSAVLPELKKSLNDLILNPTEDELTGNPKLIIVKIPLTHPLSDDEIQAFGYLENLEYNSAPNFWVFDILQSPLTDPKARLNRIKRVAEKLLGQLNALNQAMVHSVQNGGIDINYSNINLKINNESNSTIKSTLQQDMAQLNDLEGLEPIILNIQPALQSPLLSGLYIK